MGFYYYFYIHGQSCKDCENGPIFKSKVEEDLGDKVLSPDPAVGFILNRPVSSYLNKEAALQLR